jgi:hypothetical protein
MFFKPEWYNKLPYHLKPEDAKIQAFESLRIKLDFSHDLFMAGIVNSPWAFIRAQEATLENLKKNMPNATEKELWRGVLITRLGMKVGIQGVLDSSPQFMPPDIEAIDKIMANINSFDELISHMLSVEKENLMDSDPIQRQIDKLLFQSENTA